MSWSREDDWEPNRDTSYCPECDKEVEIKREDQGIGPYEFWGSKGWHHDWRWVCTECGNVIGVHN